MKRWLISVLAGVLLAGAALAAQAATDEERIEEVIAAIVQAFEKGDYASLSQHYAPEVTVVPGDYNPPVVGWAAAEQRYRAAFARFTGVVMSRENTRIERRGKSAWAVYQWQFVGMAGSQPFTAVGHTTLVLEKRGGKWLVVHNHTSAIPAPPAAETPADAQQPAPPR